MQYSEILGLNPQQILFELVKRHSTFEQRGIGLDKLVIGPSSETTAHSKNTLLVVSPSPGSGLVNPVTVYYNRLDFSKLSVYQGSTQRWPLYVDNADNVLRVSDLLGLIAETYGIVLNPTDIIDVVIDKDTYPYRCEVVPTANNQVWVGVLPIILMVGSNDLNILIRNNVLESLSYTSDDTSRVQGPLVSYSWFVKTGELMDGVALPADGKVLTVGDAYAQKLVAAMNRAGLGLYGELQNAGPEDTWMLSDTASKLNIADAVVVSDPAKIAALPFALRTDASRTVVLQLSDKSRLIGGCITLYEPSA